MAKVEFDKVGLVKEAWNIVKSNAKLFALLVIAFIIFNIVQSAVSNIFQDQYVIGFIVSLAFTVFSLLLQIGFIKITLKLIDGQVADIKELISYTEYLLRTVAASILFALAFVGGLILLVIPGIYIALRLQFFTYYIVDKNSGVVDSLKQSWEVTRGNVINILLFELLLVALNILGALALLVGLLVTIPVSYVAVTLLYRRLQK
jgi:uncharacterized membrane protein